MTAKTKTIVFTAGAVLALYGILALVLYLANAYTLPTPALPDTRRVNIGLRIFAALVGGAAFTIFAGRGIAAKIGEDRQQVSGLFWAILAASAMYALLGAIFAIESLDSLFHNLRPQWNITNEPEMILVYAFLVAAAYSCFWWKAMCALDTWAITWRVTLTVIVISVCFLMTLLAFLST